MSILSLKSVTKQYSLNSVAVKGVDLEVPQGELLALTGESGCGKTTMLRLIAGLEQPDQGTIEIEGQVVSSNQVMMPPQKRAVGLVFQDYALFPHMNVHRNIAFGLKGMSSVEAGKRVKEMLELVNLSDLDHRYPHQLSGGQQQRVAIARALAPGPKILLLDEPFSNLDTVLKDQVRRELAEILKKSGTTVILVTHDVQDALSMANRIAVLKEGYLLQVDRPRTLYSEPVDGYTASFFGRVNLVPVTSPEGKQISDFLGSKESEQSATDGFWCLRPEHITIMSTEQPGMEAEVSSVQFLGGHQQLLVRLGTLDLWCQHHLKDHLQVGQRVTLSINQQRIHLIKN